MCDCKNDVKMGSYSEAIEVATPLNKLVQIDKCIAGEVSGLWTMGIVTKASCCGHNKTPGFIGVGEGHIYEMERLGYIHDGKYGHKSCFYPKLQGAT